MPVWGKQDQKDLHEGRRGLIKQEKGASRIPGKHSGKILETVIKILERKEFPRKQIILPTKNPRKFRENICKVPGKHSRTFLECNMRNGLKATWDIPGKKRGDF